MKTGLDSQCLGAKYTPGFKPGQGSLTDSSLYDEDPVESETWLPGALDCPWDINALDTWDPSIHCLNFFMTCLCILLLDTS